VTPAPVITVKSGVTLTLKNITFKGLKSGNDHDTGNNTAPVIWVDGGNLVMGYGAVICDNTSTGAAASSPDPPWTPTTAALPASAF
jgi:hypothetical protein